MKKVGFFHSYEEKEFFLNDKCLWNEISYMLRLQLSYTQIDVPEAAHEYYELSSTAP